MEENTHQHSVNKSGPCNQGFEGKRKENPAAMLKWNRHCGKWFVDLTQVTSI